MKIHKSFGLDLEQQTALRQLLKMERSFLKKEKQKQNYTINCCN